MPSSLPTFVLVPGLWHTTVHMQPLVDVLTRQEYPTKTIQLRSVGLKTPRPTFQDDVQLIYDTVTQELQAGRDVCLVTHSFSGMPGAESLNKLIADGVLSPKEGYGNLIRAIFIAAFSFPAGFVLDACELLGSEDPGLSIDDNGILHKADPAHSFLNDMTLEQAQPWVDAMDDAYYLGRGPMISSENWRRAPVAALLCKRDNAVPLDRQEIMWQGMPREYIDTGHDPFVSRPEELADIMIRMVRED